jgi:uncharacterized RDD family membrane protein YckC
VRVTTPRPGTRPLRLPQPAVVSRRLVALLVDWLLAIAIGAGFFGYDATANLVIFFAMTVVLVGTLGSTIGHRILGLGVRGLDGGLPGPGRAAIRTLALCLVVPAIVWGPDGRGLHDRWAGTQILRLR